MLVTLSVQGTWTKDKISPSKFWKFGQSDCSYSTGPPIWRNILSEFSHGSGIYQPSGRNQKHYHGKKRESCPGQNNVPALPTVYMPGVDNWQANFLSMQCLDPDKWSLHSEMFQDLCHLWGTPDEDLLASMLNCTMNWMGIYAGPGIGSSGCFVGSIDLVHPDLFLSSMKTPFLVFSLG